jgi:hypothetical protein
LRFLNAGYDIIYSPQIQATHLVSTIARPTSRIYYTFTRNAIWVALRNHCLTSAMHAILSDLALMAFASARAGHIGSYLRGLRDGVRGARLAIQSRRPLCKNAYRTLRRIRSQEPNAATKILRHCRERLI